MSEMYTLPHRNKIIAVSVIVPLAVAALFGIPKIHGFDTTWLPQVYATINGITAVVLIAAVIAIKAKKINVHKRLIQFAIVCSLLFLLGYIAYHTTAYEAKYGDVNGDGTLSVPEYNKVASTYVLYLILLISHIILSVLIIPFVLFTYVRGINMHVNQHKRLARITFPLWLYVAISGVVVYLFIAPYQGVRQQYMINHPPEVEVEMDVID